MAEPRHNPKQPSRRSGADGAATSRSRFGAAQTRAYEDWTKDELYRQARGLHIEGRSTMSKQQLIQALQAE